MSNLSLFAKQWGDIVFDGRNKNYGAYQLRAEDNKTTYTALIVGLGMLGSLAVVAVLQNNYLNVALPMTKTYDKPEIITEVLFDEEYVKPVDNKAEVIPKKTNGGGEVTSSIQDVIKYNKIEAAVDSNVKNAVLPSQDDFSDNVTSGTETSLGDKLNGSLNGNAGVTTHGSGNGIGNGVTNEVSSVASAKNDIVKFVQVKAEPIGGFDKFYKLFIRNFQKDNLNVSASEVVIRLRFVVELDGSLTNITVLEDKYNMGNEAVNVLKKMPKWKAAQHNNTTVRSMFTLPIKIKINN